MRRVWCWVLWFLVLFAALSVAPEAQGIRRKPAVAADRYFAAVLISARNNTTGVTADCSGVLIAPHAVLTAAHAVRGFDAWQVTAPYAKGGPARSVAATSHVHPDHRPNDFENDQAVLILQKEIDLGHELPALPGGDLYPIETEVEVVGRVENGTPSRTGLYRVTVTLVPFPGSLHVYGGNPRVAEGGDSGGPVFLSGKNELIAVVSGYQGGNRRNVATDCYVPISRKSKEWIQRQLTSSKQTR